MRKHHLLFLIVVILISGCARSWEYRPIEKYAVDSQVSDPDKCRDCHEAEYGAWKKTTHADSLRMDIIPVRQLRGCSVCHENLVKHSENPEETVPPSIPKMTKAEQNQVCGKCHYNHDLLSSKSINPHVKHGLFMSVGFENKEETISCLECHAGHTGKKHMLQRIRAHTCFKCHKEAIVTMGVFQPLNYVFAGKVCSACHTVHGASTASMCTRMAVGTSLICAICHVGGGGEGE